MANFPSFGGKGQFFYSNRDVHGVGTFSYRFLLKTVMSHVESPFRYQNDGLKSDKNIKKFLRSGKGKHFWNILKRRMSELTMQESIDAYTSEKLKKKDVIGPYVK